MIRKIFNKCRFFLKIRLSAWLFRPRFYGKDRGMGIFSCYAFWMMYIRILDGSVKKTPMGWSSMEIG